MDKFPEAFERFEEEVDIEDIEGMTELKLVFSEWLGRGWKNTARQNEALRNEGMKAGIVKPRKENNPNIMRSRLNREEDFPKKEECLQTTFYHRKEWDTTYILKPSKQTLRLKLNSATQLTRFKNK